MDWPTDSAELAGRIQELTEAVASAARSFAPPAHGPPITHIEVELALAEVTGVDAPVDLLKRRWSAEEIRETLAD